MFVSHLQPVRGRMPQAGRPVFAARHDERQLRVEGHGRHVVRVPLQHRHRRFGLVVPHPGRPVIRARDEVGPVPARAVGHRVDALGVALQREVGDGRPQRPDFHGAVQGGGRKGVGVFRVDGQGHDVVGVALEDL